MIIEVSVLIPNEVQLNKDMVNDNVLLNNNDRLYSNAIAERSM